MRVHGIEGAGLANQAESKPFRIPDWETLNELGPHPTWLIETTQGLIRIKLKTADAPFTVSSAYHLLENHLYDDVVFHRVVPNFVIQGGDFDRRDGFGGPEYRIPTEPSFGTFSRGKVGMASSGPDTEGSQFFITHTWTPHLDGLYTIFGEVIEGMDVVDRIQVGDRIIRAWIEI
ncbi:MAG: peptidylprolyl isomerase [Balneolaceae bacterium]|nr:MAG: peptidylprolyl isomerase [Balneolaceae bacterium]